MNGMIRRYAALLLAVLLLYLFIFILHHGNEGYLLTDEYRSAFHTRHRSRNGNREAASVDGFKSLSIKNIPDVIRAKYARLRAKKKFQDSRIFTPEQIEEFQNGYSHDRDLAFLQYIRQQWLIAPSSLPYNLTQMAVLDVSEYNQTTFVDQLLEHKTRGFFVECGAADGQYMSNSLYLERHREWTGLLIEANPHFHKRMLKARRKAYSINACLSTENKTSVSNFRPVGLLGGLDKKMDPTHEKYISEIPEFRLEHGVQCFTLNSLMAALGRRQIDFSLDIEGPELDVLQTIPFDQLWIGLIQVEYRSWGGYINVPETLRRLHAFRSFFQSLGIYREVGIIPQHPSGNKTLIEQQGLDVFFQRIN